MTWKQTQKLSKWVFPRVPNDWVLEGFVKIGIRIKHSELLSWSEVALPLAQYQACHGKAWPKQQYKFQKNSDMVSILACETARRENEFQTGEGKLESWRTVTRLCLCRLILVLSSIYRVVPGHNDHLNDPASEFLSTHWWNQNPACQSCFIQKLTHSQRVYTLPVETLTL